MNTANIILTVILSSIALATIIIQGVDRKVKSTLRNMLIEEGLIRPGKGNSADHWPNGWHNLPDTLQGIYESIPKPE